MALPAMVGLADPDDFAVMNEECGRWFPQNPPARYAAKLGAVIPGLLVSIRITAFVGYPLRPQQHVAPLRPTQPVVDAVVVRGEAVADAGLGAAGRADLAIDGADVGPDRVGAEVGEAGDIRVALALGDEREDLRLAVGDALEASGPVQAGRTRGAAAGVADHHLAGMHGFDGGDEFRGGSVFDR